VSADGPPAASDLRKGLTTSLAAAPYRALYNPNGVLSMTAFVVFAFLAVFLWIRTFVPRAFRDRNPPC